ncbi:MAG: nitroreductase family protein [Chloroflexota bacterium]
MVLEAILKRRSHRDYSDEPVSEEQVTTLLQAAMAAPSANDQRPWQFLVVRDPELRRALARTHPYSGMAERAPVVFVVCGEEARSPHWMVDCSAATENLLLQATAMGLGGCWVACFPRQEREAYVRNLLGIPEEVRVLCMVPLGNPAAPRTPRTRYEVERVHYERY